MGLIRYHILIIFFIQNIQSQNNFEIEYGVSFNYMAIDTSKISDFDIKSYLVKSENEARRLLKYDKTLAVLNYNTSDNKVIFNFVDIMQIDGQKPISLYLKGVHEFTHNINNNKLILTSSNKTINPKKLEWTVESEVKYILDYKCQKAISFFQTRNGDNKKIVAWFTSQIPIPSGPYIYSGLPGLILEVDNHLGRKIYARKIHIN
jgi:GLPGLI family protein